MYITLNRTEESVKINACESYLNFSDILGEDEYYGTATEGMKDVFIAIGRFIHNIISWIKNHLLCLFGKADELIHVYAIEAIVNINKRQNEIMASIRKAKDQKMLDDIDTSNNILEPIEKFDSDLEPFKNEVKSKIFNSRDQQRLYRRFPTYKQICADFDLHQKYVDKLINECTNDQDDSLISIDEVVLVACRNLLTASSKAISDLSQFGLYSEMKSAIKITEDEIGNIDID